MTSADDELEEGEMRENSEGAGLSTYDDAPRSVSFGGEGRKNEKGEDNGKGKKREREKGGGERMRDNNDVEEQKRWKESEEPERGRRRDVSRDQMALDSTSGPGPRKERDHRRRRRRPGKAQRLMSVSQVVSTTPVLGLPSGVCVILLFFWGVFTCGLYYGYDFKLDVWYIIYFCFTYFPGLCFIYTLLFCPAFSFFLFSFLAWYVCFFLHQHLVPRQNRVVLLSFIFFSVCFTPELRLKFEVYFILFYFIFNS